MRRAWGLAIGLLSVTAAHAAYPERPIQMLLPFTAGGSIDLLGRVLADELTAGLGQPVVVSNRDGASGTIMAGAIATAKPDGYTIGFTPVGAWTTQLHMNPKLPYARDSIRPVCETFEQGYALIVRGDSPYRSAAELVAAGHRTPGKLPFGAAGRGTAAHLTGLGFLHAAKLDVIEVAYRGDAALATAMNAGDVAFGTMVTGTARAQGFRLLGIFSAQRQPDFEDVPTIREQGFDVVGVAFGGIVVPKETSDDIAARLEQACRAAVQSARYRAMARQTTQPVAWRDGAAFGREIDADYAAKGEIVRRAKLVD
ncbi:MAG: tripartite tricarboxylate transporter substrate binding protein [Alphaproteobacteria bacterium]|nr:tripartite tricarboxylate transporter substrate binding protein [Alphaproteobacteria bacterium]